MDTNTLLCVVEVLGILILATLAVIARYSTNLRKSLEAASQTSRGARPQWMSILAGILGANLGYIILIGAYVLATRVTYPAEADDLLIPAAVVAYVMCGLPAYLGIGAISGLLVYRFTQRKALAARTGLLLSLAISAIFGALAAIPIFMIGLMGAAL